MGDSESFTSLMDLVNSHLSKTSLNISQSGDEGSPTHTVASVRVQTGFSQTAFTPPNGINSIPRLSSQDNAIHGILAQQVTNMLIAKKKKELEEQEKTQRLEEIKVQQQQNKIDDDYVIDLMPSIVVPKQDKMPKQPLLVAASTSSFKSMTGIINKVKVPSQIKSLKALEPKETLPLNQNVSSMLYDKVRKDSPSAFGKVISSYVMLIAAPYLKVEVNNQAIQRFDFSTQSPCDINFLKKLFPPIDPYAHMNMVERFTAMDNETLTN